MKIGPHWAPNFIFCLISFLHLKKIRLRLEKPHVPTETHFHSIIIYKPQWKMPKRYSTGNGIAHKVPLDFQPKATIQLRN